MGFTPILIELFTVKPRVNIEFHYNYDSEVKLITAIKTPCDCTRVYVDRATNSIVVDYTPYDVPIHLIRQGKTYYNTVKIIEISYTNTSDAALKQNVVFTARVGTYK